MFIREYFIFDRIINRVDQGIDPYGAAFFVLQRAQSKKKSPTDGGTLFLVTRTGLEPMLPP